jgi:hypothetical protein
MKKIENWQEIEAKGMEDFKSLPIGAYECVIRKAEVYKNPTSGKESFRVQVDIASGEYKGYFQKKYDNNTSSTKTWDNNSTRYLAFEGDNVSYFKGFITGIENSNPGYKWDWDETKLTGKKICGVYQYEEYENQEGKRGVKVRLNKFRSLDKMKDIEVSYNVKLLDGTYMDIDDYNEKKENATAEEIFGPSIVETDTGDIPFEI